MDKEVGCQLDIPGRVTVSCVSMSRSDNQRALLIWSNEQRDRVRSSTPLLRNTLHVFKQYDLFFVDHGPDVSQRGDLRQHYLVRAVNAENHQGFPGISGFCGRAIVLWVVEKLWW
jgi:hypothetical protein